MKLDILAFGAHPDDVELGCAGTIAKEIFAGKKVGVIDLTEGELGTRGSVEKRYQEASKASAILGLSHRENLKMKDGFFINDAEHQLEIIKRIRKFQPKIILCNAIEDRHIDHAKASKLVSDAAFLSGLVKIETIYEDEIQKPWRPNLVLHYIQWKDITPDVVVDISSTFLIKKEAILAYDSQFYSENSNEPETPIATKNFLDSITYRAQNLGRIIGVSYAEGFTAERYIGVNSIEDLI